MPSDHAPLRVDGPTRDAIIEALREQGARLPFDHSVADFIESRFPVSTEPYANHGDGENGSGKSGITRPGPSPACKFSYCDDGGCGCQGEPSPGVLREALERIDRLPAKWGAAQDGGEAWAAVGSEAHRIAHCALGGDLASAREALAASPPAEPTYEWRTVERTACCNARPGHHDLRTEGSTGPCCTQCRRYRPDLVRHREQRVKVEPLPWERVTDDEGRRDG